MAQLMTISRTTRDPLSHGYTYRTGTGQFLQTHEEDPDCAALGCAIHHPTDTTGFPTHWRGDRGIMERICPHGVGHPDRDGLAYIARTHGDERAAWESIHGCDGCCGR